MTRINSAIPVRCLTDEHLLAEHREIKRLPYALAQAIKSGAVNKIPEQFVLGKGHVLFFIDKMMFVFLRYLEIHGELCVRGFRVQDYRSNWSDVEQPYWHDYDVTDRECVLLKNRIKERIKNSTKTCWHYYGKQITKDDAIKLLNN